MGAAGMFATGRWQPIIGGWLDTEKEMFCKKAYQPMQQI